MTSVIREAQYRMDGMLSLDEIDALTGGGGAATKTAYAGETLSDAE